MVETSFGIGLVVGPSLGGLFHNYWGFSTPFWTLGVLTLVLAGFSACILKPSKLPPCKQTDRLVHFILYHFIYQINFFRPNGNFFKTSLPLSAAISLFQPPYNNKKIFADLFTFSQYKKSKLFMANFLKIINIHKPSPGLCEVPQQIGSAVFTKQSLIQR